MPLSQEVSSWCDVLHRHGQKGVASDLRSYSFDKAPSPLPFKPAAPMSSRPADRGPGRRPMCTDHGDKASAEMARLLGRRGFLRAGAVAAAAVGAAGTLAAPAEAAPRPAAGGHGPAAAGCRSTRSASSSTPCATSSPPTPTAPSPPSPTSATAGWSTPASPASPRPRSAPLLDANGIRATSGHVGIPQPFDAAAWQGTLADARTLGSPLRRPPVLRRRTTTARSATPRRGARSPATSTAPGSLARGPGSGSATTTTTSSSSALDGSGRPASTS